MLHHVREMSWGANRKVGLQYALEQHHDLVLMARTDDPFANSILAALIEQAVVNKAQVVRGVYPHNQNRITRLLNFILKQNLTGYAPGPWLIEAEVLKALPFAQNSDDELFDLQLLIQCKALEKPILEIVLDPHAESGFNQEQVHALRMLHAALHYRLHQVHLFRHGRWLVDFGEEYTFKRSPFSSHKQILNAIEPHSKVLDLGCSQGMLAGKLAQKGCWVGGVDSLSPDRVDLPYDRYLQGDLDDPNLQIPFGREFDVVILADVIEHLRSRQSLMQLVRRHLTAQGKLIISTGNLAIWFYRTSLLLGRFEYGARGILDDTHVRLYTKATFERLLQQSGFEIVQRQTTSLPFEIIFQSSSNNAIVHFLDRQYHRLTRLWPEMFAYQFILHARIARLETGETLGPSPTKESTP